MDRPTQLPLTPDEPLDEEALAADVAGAGRRSQGVYFTPAPLVSWMLEAVSPHLPGRGFSVVDPACGAGAFLSAAVRHWPRARPFGIELSERAAAACRRRVPSARVLQGNALAGGFAQLQRLLPPDQFELWLGNPPYNGTSPLLADGRGYRALLSDLPSLQLPPGTSLRDDYAFFLLWAAQRLTQVPGALAFVTSASLLDSFLYAPVRRVLLERLELREVLELGPGVFRGTRVRTCVTVWTTGTSRLHPVRYRRRPAESAEGFEPSTLSPVEAFTPRPPDFLLRPTDEAAAALDAAWSAEGVPLSQLVPISFPGLKTRFDELLVDDDPARLLERLDDFFRASEGAMGAFAQAHGIPERCVAKLEALKRARGVNAAFASREKIRPFWRYAGARHRGTLPQSARAYCYLDRVLIPRGDHRFRGDYDPHAHSMKLIFNVRELPLAAAVLAEPGCVHDHRHARFAPLEVPSLLRSKGLSAARPGTALGELVPNLAPPALPLTARRGALEVFRAITEFINSPPVQQVWAPVYGASRELPVPLWVLEP